MWLFVTLALISVAQGKPAAESATVTIPVAEYLDLKKAEDQEKITSIEDVSLKGKFGTTLSLTFTGRSTTGYTAKDVLTVDDRFALSDCKGDALLDVHNGAYRLVPLAKKFKLSCDLRAPNWSGVELNLRNVLAFDANVSGAEVLAERNSDQGRHVVLASKSKPQERSTGEVTGSGKYRITVRPEETAFRYVLRLANPSRGSRTFRLPLPNGEIVQKTRGIASFEESEKGITLTLSPGDNELVVQGRYTSAKFVPLLPSEQQTLLVESHPTLLLTAEGKARRITPNDNELRPQFTNARVYVLGKDSELSWTTRKLDVLESTGFSVSNASYRYYLPENGGPVVEANYVIQNQGTPEVAFDVPGTPTYLEVAGAPQVLYKSPDGKLLAQVPPGQTSILLQYRTDRQSGVTFAAIGEKLVKPEAVLSNVSIALLTPAKWKLLFGAGLAGGGSDFSTDMVVVAFLMGVLCFVFGTLWKFPKRTRWLFTVSAAGLTFFVSEFVPVLVAGAAAAVLCRYRHPLWKFFRAKPLRSAIIAAVLAIPAGILLLTALAQMVGTSRNMAAKSLANHNYAMQNARPSKSYGKDGDAESSSGGFGRGDMSPPAGEPGLANHGSDTPTETVDDAKGYQGLPARIDIPTDVTWTTFNQSMVDRNGRVMLRAWLVSQTVVGMLAMLCFATAGGLLFRRRKDVLHWAWAPKTVKG